MKIKKNNNTFFISNDNYSKSWFSNNRLDRWEQDTFMVLDYFKIKSLEYI